MILKYSRFIYLFLSFFLVTRAALACRYTVREIGYTDLGVEPYRLVLVLEDGSAAISREDFEKIRFASFLNSNMTADMMYRSAADSITGTYLDSAGTVLPAALLISPEGRITLVEIPEAGTFKEGVWQMLEHIAASALRREIVTSLVNGFAAILIIEGTDQADYDRSVEQVKRAKEDFRAYRPLLPRQVDADIRIFRITSAARAQEEILLWSLGIESSSSPSSVTVLYGRGRRMGPVLSGSHIQSVRIVNLLSIIGADCECGVDQSWKLGPMLPVTWGFDYQKKAAGVLGFDPEHPVIKSEMSQILKIKQRVKKKTAVTNPLKDNILKIDTILAAESDFKVVGDDYLQRVKIPLKLGWILLIVSAAVGLVIFIVRKRR